MSHVITADDPAAFDREVRQATLPVVVDFWAPWCGPCRLVAPELEALAEEMAGRVKVVKVNVDQVPSVAAEFRVQGIPTIGRFDQGRMTASVVGARPRRDIVNGLHLGDVPAPAPTAGDRAPVEERTTARPRVDSDGRY